jgi:hypothetical protein
MFEQSTPAHAFFAALPGGEVLLYLLSPGGERLAYCLPGQKAFSALVRFPFLFLSAGINRRKTTLFAFSYERDKISMIIIIMLILKEAPCSSIG